MKPETPSDSLWNRFRRLFEPPHPVDMTILEHDPRAEAGQGGDRPRILLVSDDREVADSVITLCADADWPVRIILDPTSWAPADDWSPSVALLDGRSGIDLGPLTERLHEAEDQLAIAVLDSGAEDHTMDQGWAIDESIHLPLDNDALRLRLTGLQARRPHLPFAPVTKKGGQLIVVCGTSGGVGTTTVATNLAAALGWTTARSSGTMCALVDGSLHFADQRVLLDITREAPGIVEVATATDSTTLDALRLALIRYEPGLVVLPGSATPEDGDRITGARFEEILKALCSLYPFTVVDVGRELNEPMLRAFDLADDILLVTSGDLIALKNARLMLDLLGRLGQTTAKIRLVLNRVGAPGALPPTEVAGVFDRLFDIQLPEDIPTAGYALVHGRPFTFDRREMPLARAIGNLAALFAKTGAHRQLDFLKERGFPKGLTKLFLTPTESLLPSPEQPLDLGSPDLPDQTAPGPDAGEPKGQDLP